MSNQALLNVLLLKWRSYHEQGQTVSAEELCRDCPELLPDLKERVRQLQMTPDTVDGSTPAGHSTGACGETPEMERTTDFKPGETAVASPARAGRYLIRDEIARGGMGAVFRAHDPSLDRPLAIKVMLGNRPESQKRFWDEAKIAGQLQHPGVAPLYDVGQLDDGRPFFAMKLIEGRTLADLLRNRDSWIVNRESDSEKSQGDSRLTTHDSRLIHIFEQICQTIAFAHSRGVIHRDLKPANIMVGAFGEVQVMDWGLAKTQANESTDPAFDETITLPGVAVPAEPEETKAGTVLGSPAFMAPEQARGEIHNVDRRSDVFGLGAIMCVILTGKPPFAGAGGSDALKMAASGELTDTWRRLDDCGADAELIQLAKRCLAPQRAERPRDAGVVAEAVNAYQRSVQEKLRTAELEKTAAQAKAGELRKRLFVTFALAAAVLLLALGGGGAAFWYREHLAAERLRVAQVENDASVALSNAKTLRKEALNLTKKPSEWKAKLASALSEFQLAETLSTKERSAVNPRLRDRIVAVKKQLDADKNDQDLISWLDVIRMEQSRVDVRISNFQRGNAFTTIKEAFRKHLFDIGKSKLEHAVAVLKQKDEVIRKHIVTALDVCLHYAPPQETGVREWLAKVLQKADSNAWRNAVRSAKAKGDTSALKALVSKVDVAEQPPAFLVLLVARDPYDRRRHELELLKRTQQAYPNDFWANHDLALLLTQRQRPADALPFYAAAIALRPGNAGVYVNYGESLRTINDWNRAIAAFRRATELAPEYTTAYAGLGATLLSKGDFDGAIAEYQKALQLKPEGSQLANLFVWCGTAYELKGNLYSAIENYRKSIDAEPGHSHAYYNMGGAYEKMNDLENAVLNYRRAIKKEPKQATFHYAFGRVLLKQNKVKEAATEFHEAIAWESKNELAISANLTNSDAPRRYFLSTMSYVELGKIAQNRKDLEDAVAFFRKAIKANPSFAQAHHRLAGALVAKGAWNEAIAAFRKTVALAPKNIYARLNLGNVLSNQERFAEAIPVFEELISLKPDHAEAHFNLGRAYKSTQQYTKAVKAFRQCTAIDPKHAPAHFALGYVLSKQKNYRDAIAAFRQGLAVHPLNSFGNHNLGNALRATGQFDAALAAYRKAVKRDPRMAESHYHIGSILQMKSDVVGALAAFRRALEARKEDAEVHINMGSALSDLGRLEEAHAAAEKALQLNPALMEVFYNLGVSLQRQGKFADSLFILSQGLRFVPKNDKRRMLVVQMANLSKQLAAYEKKLPEVLAGKINPKDYSEQIQYAHVCHYQKKYKAAAGFYDAALKANPEFAKNLQLGVRFNAACVAALAGDGRGIDSQKTDGKERTQLRSQSLNWLKADYDLLNEIAKSNSKAAVTAAYKLKVWQHHADLAGVRDNEKLAKLPDTERKSWQKLWTDVGKFVSAHDSFQVATAPPKKIDNKDPPKTTPIVPIKGKLAAGDPLDNFPPTKKSFAKVHVVKLDAGKHYQIDLTGSFDTFLRVEDAQKNPLLYNDDVFGPTNLNSRLILHSKKAGNYRFVVTSFKPGDTGAYALTYGEVQPAGKPKILTSALTERDKNKDGRFAKTVKIKLVAGQPHTIIAESTKFDPVLLLVDPTGKKTLHAQNNDVAPGNRNARIDFTPAITANYTLIVGSVRPGQGGEFAVRLQAFTK